MKGGPRFFDPMRESSQTEMLSPVSGIMASGCESWSVSSYGVTLRDAGTRLGLTYQQGQSRNRARAQVPGDIPGPLPPTPPLDLPQCEIRSFPLLSCWTSCLRPEAGKAKGEHHHPAEAGPGLGPPCR